MLHLKSNNPFCMGLYKIIQSHFSVSSSREYEKNWKEQANEQMRLKSVKEIDEVVN